MNNSADIEATLNELVERLHPIGIYRLILFGSHADHTSNGDSDVDLLLVTRDETIPQTFAEKAKIDIAANRLIDAVRARIPVDLIVHTRAMHRRFLRADSAFSREITQKGRILYEDGHKRVA